MSGQTSFHFLDWTKQAQSIHKPRPRQHSSPAVTNATFTVYSSQESPPNSKHPRKFDDDPEQRRSILQDLFNAERDYVETLQQLKEIYIDPTAHPILADSKGKHYVEIPETEWRAAFHDIRKIIEYTTVEILPALAMTVRQLEAMGHDTDGVWSRRAALEVAELLNARSSYIKDLYEAYGKSICNATLTVQRWENPPGDPGYREQFIEKYMQDCRTDEQHTLRNLRQYLELPLRRLAHYELFIKHLARNTSPKETPDGLDTALKFVSSLYIHVSQTKRLAELRSQLRPLSDPDAPFYNQTLKAETAELLMEGPLTLVRYLTRESIVIIRDHIMIDDEELLFPRDRTETLDTVYYQQKHDALEGTRLLGVLLADRLVLLNDGDDVEGGALKIFGVLKMSEMKDNIKLCGLGRTYLRVVCGHNAYYLDAGDRENAKQWLDAMKKICQSHQSEPKRGNANRRTRVER